MKYRVVAVILITLSMFFCSIGCTDQWYEYEGEFQTTDLARAQQEIPFSIILPTYLPREMNSSRPPSIKGPLSTNQEDNKIQVWIYYVSTLNDETLGRIHIRETNYPISPLDPKLNPEYKYVEIQGITMVKLEGNFALGPGSIIYFNREGIYYRVEVYRFPYNEAVKIVESMLD